jgi:hypothetical protein
LWLRHQIHLKSNDLYEALGDLNEITEANPKHYAAWFAKARLLKIQSILIGLLSQI